MRYPVFRKPDGTVFTYYTNRIDPFCTGVSCKYCAVAREKGRSPCYEFILNDPKAAARCMGYEFIGMQGYEAKESSPSPEPLGPTGFVRDARAGKGRMDLLPWVGIMEVSKLCEEGAEHYGERNIDKGAPLHSLLDSGARHLAKVMSGYTDEDHLRAACWNLLWALQERTTHPELNDTPWPWYGEKEEKKNMNTRAMFSSATDLWETPQEFFDKLNQEFHFNLDVCALPENAKCAAYYTPEIDGLSQPWLGSCWCNPPYGRQISRWVKKAAQSAQDGATVVMLLPARTDTAWFHEYIYGRAEIRFIRGRLKFGGSKNSAPFPSMVVVFKGIC